MKNKLISLSALFFCISSIVCHHPVRDVQQVVIWAYKIGEHTHSYIHWGFYRGFKHLGYKTLWLTDRDDVSNIDFSNSLFLTMGATANHRMPIRTDCYYMIHNGNPNRYKQLVELKRCIYFQVYTHDCLTRKDPMEKPFFHYNIKDNVIYMPWATDLLPHEIDAIKKELPNVHKKRESFFVGSIYGENKNELNALAQGCRRNNIKYVAEKAGTCTMEENIKRVQEALIAPALQWSWQIEKGYIPCRIFKNISYGAMGVTNSKAVYDLFEGKIVYNPNAQQLVSDTLEAQKTWTLEKQYELMDLVRDQHTYLNRIASLFNFFETKSQFKG